MVRWAVEEFLGSVTRSRSAAEPTCNFTPLSIGMTYFPVPLIFSEAVGTGTVCCGPISAILPSFTTTTENGTGGSTSEAPTMAFTGRSLVVHDRVKTENRQTAKIFTDISSVPAPGRRALTVLKPGNRPDSCVGQGPH